MFAKTSAVVTGSSSGIGRAIAIALAEAGVDKMIIHGFRNQGGAEETASRAESLGCESKVVISDVASENGRSELIESAFDFLGEVNTWVNNAGADVLTGDAADWSFNEKLRRLFRSRRFWHDSDIANGGRKIACSNL